MNHSCVSRQSLPSSAPPRSPWAGPGLPFLSSPFAPHRSLVCISTTLSDTLIKHGANKHFSNSAGELIMNRFMSNYSISASLCCSHAPQLQSNPSLSRHWSEPTAAPVPHPSATGTASESISLFPALRQLQGGMTAIQGLKRGSEPPANE